ncbi:hypothetical protein AB0C93_00050 [Streptomyces sp. NPDC048518]|uniref:hypothetical protein n=1 Tax=Streptomyces sp. NPDC048518 TaxID=3155029 RepID=UPI0033C92235
MTPHPAAPATGPRPTVALMRGRTAVVVAHRTSLLPHADRIVTVRAGTLATTPPADPELTPTESLVAS